MPIRRNSRDPVYLDDAEGVRRRAAAEARPVLLPGGRAQLQRRDEAAEDRLAAMPRFRRTIRDLSSSRQRWPTTSSLEDHVLARQRVKRRNDRSAASCRNRPARRRLQVARVRHVRRADLVDGVDPNSRRAVLEFARTIMKTRRTAVQGAADGAGRRGHAAVDHARGIWKSALRRSSTRSAPAARTSASPADREAVDAAIEPLEARGILVAENGTAARSRPQRAAILRAFARSSARVSVPPHALSLVDVLMAPVQSAVLRPVAKQSAQTAGVEVRHGDAGQLRAPVHRR